MAKNESDVLTLQQLCQYLQIPRSTLYRVVRDGTIPGQKVGRQWRFHREAVDRWLSQGSRDRGAEK
jgi:excisionase family DNA binding protein